MLNRLIKDLLPILSISDFHVQEGACVWVRDNGILRPGTASKGPIKRQDVMDFLHYHESTTGLPSDKVEEVLQKRGDVDITCSIDKVRFRGNLYRSNGRQLAIALRRVSDEIPRLDQLNLPPKWLKLVESSRGLLLVTGATGSGKTTTTASTLDYINHTRNGHILTLEDPVEYILTSKKCLINQRHIGRDAPEYQSALRAAMREDPDVIFIGELRDEKTVKTALDAANTGHLVISTLHTLNAQQSVERIMSFFPPEQRDWAQRTLAQVLLGTISQVLVPTADKQGRVLAAELMVNTNAVKQAIGEGKPNQIFSAMDTGSQDGQLLLNKSLAELVLKRKISPEEALFRTYNSDGLLKDLTRA